MTIFLLTGALFALAMAAMAVGVIVSGRRLRGSCGGVGAADCWCEKNGLPPGSARLAAAGSPVVAGSLAVLPSGCPRKSEPGASRP